MFIAPGTVVRLPLPHRYDGGRVDVFPRDAQDINSTDSAATLARLQMADHHNVIPELVLAAWTHNPVDVLIVLGQDQPLPSLNSKVRLTCCNAAWFLKSDRHFAQPW